MAGLGQQRETDSSTNTVAALGLRRAALRGMLGSPLIEADDQKELREELVSELQSVGQSMAKLSSRNVAEVCAKLDVLGEDYRTGGDGAGAQNLIASIRRDVTTLLPRPAPERAVHPVRTLHTGRPIESHPPSQPVAQAAPSAAGDAPSSQD
jgi:hypothetical protein